MLYGGIVNLNRYYPGIASDEYKKDFIQIVDPYFKAENEWNIFIEEMIGDGVIISEEIKSHEKKFKLNAIKGYAFDYDLNHRYSKWNITPVIDDYGVISITCTKKNNK